MTASNTLTSGAELFQAGRLQDAIHAQTAVVKDDPTDHGKRLFLFELFAFAGDLDRARKQIEAVEYNDAELDSAVAAYRRLLTAETARRELFSTGRRPSFFAESPEHMNLRLAGLDALREGRAEEAAKRFRQADEATPVPAASLNGQAIELLRDCDDVFGGVLELMNETGGYFWLPLEQIESLSVAAPKSPRDLLWAPAQLLLQDGQAGAVYLPAVYPDSWRQDDDQLKLGRAADWKQVQQGPVIGYGARTFLFNDDAISLLEWRELTV